MAKRELSQLESDLQGFAGLALECLAHDLVGELQKEGEVPEWDGYFINAWQVNLGKEEVPADRQKSTDFQGDHPVTIQQIPIPPQPLKPVGYRIGNRMEYANIAMDLEPDPEGQYRGDRAGSTAPKDWFTTLMNGGKLEAITNGAVGRAAQIIEAGYGS
jgi:hypothetical protein